jgi:Ca-activated chloride channel family protein
MQWLEPQFWLAAEQPAYLILLAVLPLLIAFSYRSLAGLGPVRRGFALGLRCVVVVLLVFALAGFNTVHQIDDQTAVFVLDTSASVSHDLQRRGFDFARRATQAMRRGKDRAALVSFSGAAIVQQLAGDGLHIDRFGPAPRPYETNIAAGIRFATAILPPDSARRLVVLSDGNSNAGDAMVEADQLRAAGIPVDVVPLTFTHEHEVVFERLAAPVTARLEETINLSAILRSTRPVRGLIRVYHNDALLDLGPGESTFAFPAELDAGPNRLTIPIPLRESGMHRFRAVFEPTATSDDTITQNNEAQAFTIVGGRPRVLIIGDITDERRPEERDSARMLADALRREGIESQVRSLGEISIDGPTLTTYPCVILNNISAFTLSSEGQAALASYVRDLGGGLIVLGGDQAFSMGGYVRTPLEGVLPVETARDKLNILSLSMVIVLDRSGSMEGEKLDLAKSAAAGAVQLLSRLDRIGVVAFDSRPEWVVPLSACERKAAIQSRIHRIGGGGGTDMYPALEQAVSALQASDTSLRHVILLTDGRSAPGDFDGLAQRMVHAGITLSAIAVGSDADRDLLDRIASTTGGRMYVTDSARPLPQIFARETVLASRSGMFERQFMPVLRPTLDSPIVSGFQASDFPPLEGHVITAGKPLAQVPIVRVTDDGADPILAHWQVGLGRSVAFTSGMWARWGTEWVSWPGFPKLWAQAVRWASRPANSADFDARVAIDGSRATLTLEAAPELSAERVGIRFDGQVVDPAFHVRALRLRQTGPSRYECVFPLGEFGNYVVRVAFSAGQGTASRSGVVQAALSYSYSAEWSDVQSDDVLLTEVARRTEGRVLNLQHADAVYEPWSIRPVQSRRPLWEDFVRLALILFLLDVAVRRLAVTPLEAARRLRGFIAELAGVAAAPSADTLTSLRGARDRARDVHEVASPEAGAGIPPETGGSSEALGGPASPPSDHVAEPAAPTSKRPAKPNVATETPGYAERLRRAKRRARGEQDRS